MPIEKYFCPCCLACLTGFALYYIYFWGMYFLVFFVLVWFAFWRIS